MSFIVETAVVLFHQSAFANVRMVVYMKLILGVLGILVILVILVTLVILVGIGIHQIRIKYIMIIKFVVEIPFVVRTVFVFRPSQQRACMEKDVL